MSLFLVWEYAWFILRLLYKTDSKKSGQERNIQAQK